MAEEAKLRIELANAVQLADDRRIALQRLQDTTIEKDKELLHLRVEVTTLTREKDALRADMERSLERMRSELRAAQENESEAKRQAAAATTALDKVREEMKSNFNPDDITVEPDFDLPPAPVVQQKKEVDPLAMPDFGIDFAMPDMNMDFGMPDPFSDPLLAAAGGGGFDFGGGGKTSKELEACKEDLKKVQDELKTTKSALNKKLSASGTAFKKSQAEVAILEAAKANLNQLLAQVTKQRDQSSERNLALETRLNVAAEESRSARDERTALSKQIIELETKVAGLNRTITDLNDDKQRTASRLQAVQGEGGQLAQDHANLKTAKVAVDTQLAQTVQLLDTAKADIARLVEEVKEKSLSSGDSQSKINNLQSELIQREKTIASLNNECAIWSIDAQRMDVELQKLSEAHRADQLIVSNLYSGDYGTLGCLQAQDLGDFPTVLVELKFSNMTLDGWIAKAELNEFSFLRGVSRCLGASIEELGSVSARRGVTVSLSFQSKIPPAQINNMLDSAGFNLFAGTSLSKDFFSSTCTGSRKGPFLQLNSSSFQAPAKSLIEIASLQNGVLEREALVSKLTAELKALNATLDSTKSALEITSQGKATTESKVAELQKQLQGQESHKYEIVRELENKKLLKEKKRQFDLISNFCYRYEKYEIFQGWRMWKKKIGKYKNGVIEDLKSQVARQSANIFDLETIVQGLRTDGTQLQLNLERTQNDLRQRNETIAVLEPDLKLTKGALAEAQATIVDFKKDTSGLNTGLAQARSACLVAESQVRDLTKDLSIANADITSKKAEIDSLQHKVEQTSSQLADRDGQVKALTNDLSITVAKALKDNSDKDAAISTLTADLKFTSETLSSLKLRSSGDNEVKDQTIARLTAELKDTQAHLNNCENKAREDNTQNGNSIANLTAELKVTRGNLLSTEEKLVETRAELASTQDSLRSTKATLVLTESNLAASIAERKSKEADSSADLKICQATLVSTEQSLRVCQNDLRVTADSLASTQRKASDDNFEKSNTIARLNTDIIRLTENLSETRAQLQRTKDELSSVARNAYEIKADLASDLKSAERQLANVKDDLTRFEQRAAADNADKSATISTLSATIASIEQKAADDHTAQAKIIYEVSSELKQTQITLAATEKNAETIIKDKSDTIQRLSKDLNTTQENLAVSRLKHNEDNANNAAAIASLQSDLKTVRDHLNATEQKAVEDNYRNSNIIAKLNVDLKTTREMLTEAERRHTQQLADKDAAIATVSKNLKAVTGSLESAKADIVARVAVNDKLVADLKLAIDTNARQREEQDKGLRTYVQLMADKDEAIARGLAELKEQEVHVSEQRSQMARLQVEVENQSKKRLEASLLSEKLSSEKHALQSKLRLRDEVAQDLSNTISRLQDVLNQDSRLPAGIPPNCACALLRPQLFAFIKICIATEATIDGREVDPRDERVVEAERSRVVQYNTNDFKTATPEGFYEAEKRSLLLLTSILEETIVAVAEGSRRKITSEQKFQAELKLRETWLEDLQNALGETQDELQEVKLTMAPNDEIADRLRMERSRVVAARLESEENQKNQREEIETLRGYLVASQEAFAELTGDTSRPAIIMRAARMLAKLKPWVGINIQKSIFEQCSQSGVTIVTLKQGGPASDAGLKQGGMNCHIIIIEF